MNDGKDELFEVDDDPYQRMEREDTHISTPTLRATPFPEVLHRSKKKLAPKPKVQPTVAAQIVEKPSTSETPTTDLAQQIHEENTQKIASMSVSEISAAQQDILKALDPSLINMLRSRKSRNEPPSQTTSQLSQTSSQTPPYQLPSQTSAQSSSQVSSIQLSSQTAHQPIQLPPTLMQISSPTATPTQPQTPSAISPQIPNSRSTLISNSISNATSNVTSNATSNSISSSQPTSPQPTTSLDSTKPTFLPSLLVAQPLKRNTPKEQEEQRRQRQEKRKKQQDELEQELREEFERSNKSAIELAEGPKAEEPATPLIPYGDVSHWRFDFEGKYVERGNQIPTHLGLHHHGDEQSEAGYTLRELHTLTRSTFSGQKIIALKTLANILRNTAKESHYAELRAHIFELKFPRLFRATLDDANPSVISATVDALHALVVDAAWEKQAIVLSHRYRGQEGLPLHPIIAQQGKVRPKRKDEEDPELDDDEYLNSDLVKGLLQMNLLNRLRYLLEVVRIPTAAVPIIEMLTQIARHSVDSAKEVFECSRMIECIVTEFVKTSCDLTSLKAAAPYSTPLVPALHLLSVMCQSSRKIAETVAKSGLMTEITRFVEAVQSNRSAISIELFSKSLFMWKIISSYGIQLECIRKVAFLFELVQNWSPTAIPDVEVCSIVTDLYNLLEVTTHASDDSSLSFDQIAFFVNPALGLLANVDLRDTSQTYFTNTAASMVHFLASYVQKLSKLFASNSGNLSSIIEHFCSTVLLPILPQFDLEFISSLNGDAKSVIWEFALGFFRLIRICTHAHRTVGALLLECNLPYCNGGMVALLWRLLLFCSNERVLRTSRTLFQHRTLFHLQYVLLKLLDEPALLLEDFPSPITSKEFSTFGEVEVPSRSILAKFIPAANPETIWFQTKHDAAMNLVLSFLPGEVVLVLDCLRSFISHPRYLEHILPTAQSKRQIAETCLEFYNEILFQTKDINTSSYLIAPTQEKIASLYLPFREHTNLYSLPLDPSYVLFPIIFHYDSKFNTPLEFDSALPPLTLDQLTHYIQFWQLLEQSGSPYLEAFIDPAVRYTTLMKVFLISEDLFLEPSVEQPLMSIFGNLTSEGTKMDLSFLSGPKFTGFLEDFISQFSAVSYGNAAFASVLFVFLRQEFPFQFRIMIWRELFEMLPLLENAVQFPLGRKGYLFPTETNSDVLNLYASALSKGKISRSKCKSLYCIAIHHISVYIFGNEITWTKQEMLQKLIMDSQSKVLVTDLLTYKYNEEITERSITDSEEKTTLILDKAQREMVKHTSSAFSEVAARLAEYYHCEDYFL